MNGFDLGYEKKMGEWIDDESVQRTAQIGIPYWGASQPVGG